MSILGDVISWRIYSSNSAVDVASVMRCPSDLISLWRAYTPQRGVGKKRGRCLPGLRENGFG